MHLCEIFAFKLYLKLGFVRRHSMSSKVAQFDTITTLYSSSIVNMPASHTVSEIYPHIGRKLLPPLNLAPPLGMKLSDLCNNPWWRKTRVMGLSDGERISMICSVVLIQYTHVKNRRTDSWNCRGNAVMRKNRTPWTAHKAQSVEFLWHTGNFTMYKVNKHKQQTMKKKLSKNW